MLVLGRIHLGRKAAAFTVAAVFGAGILFWGGFNYALEVTNRETFCISCHEMRDNVFHEYRQSVHFLNRTGVRASCPDCHVPREWSHMVVRKIKATNELYHWLIGTIDTPEKFKRRRLELARGVWRDLEKTDSRECRNCHQFDFMAMNEQSWPAAERHRRGKEQGKTCIACHIGIAHELPRSFLDSEHERFRQNGTPCSDCHAGLSDPAVGDNWYQ